MACSSEDLSSSDDSSNAGDGADGLGRDADGVLLDNHDAEPVVVEGIAAAQESDERALDVDECEPAAAEALPDVHVDRVVHLLQRAQARGKNVQALEWFTMRLGQPLPCLGGAVLTPDALNGAVDRLSADAD